MTGKRKRSPKQDEGGVDNYSLLKVPELKALCKENGLPISGRKADLIKRLKDNGIKVDKEELNEITNKEKDEELSSPPRKKRKLERTETIELQKTEENSTENKIEKKTTQIIEQKEETKKINPVLSSSNSKSKILSRLSSILNPESKTIGKKLFFFGIFKAKK